MTTISPAVVGHTLGVHTYKVDADRTKQYASATNDMRSEYVEESRPGGIIAPPLFAVVAELPLANEVIAHLSLSLTNILHGEQDMTFIAPIRPGDVLETTATVVGVTDTSTGQTITSEVFTRTQEGAPRVRSLVTIYVRDSSRERRSRQAPAGASPRAHIADHKMLVLPDQPASYAAASGDYNAPHTDDAFAKDLGFRGVILQGLCTMAFTSTAVIDSVCNGDPTKLRRLKVRFSDVVYPNDVLTTSIWSCDGNYMLETVTQDGRVVIKNGEAQVS